jgi:hypothetical protein
VICSCRWEASTLAPAYFPSSLSNFYVEKLGLAVQG